MKVKMFRSRRLLVLAICVAVLACLSSPRLLRARDVTFFDLSDIHYGQDQWSDSEQLNKNTIAVLNNFPGTPYPVSGWGNVAEPRGVTITGDLADSGTAFQWTGEFFGIHITEGIVDDYPVNGGTGVSLRYPVFEGYGNHDIGDGLDGPVVNGIISRNTQRNTQLGLSANGLHYSWDWDDVHFVQLNLYAGAAGTDACDSLSFLQSDLASRVGNSGRPVILLQHYGVDDFSRGWWTDAERQAEYDVIKDYNVLAVFAGHEHPDQPTQFMWNDIPTFVPGRAKDGKFFAVNIKDQQMLVAGYHDGQWSNSWVITVPEPSSTYMCVVSVATILGCVARKKSFKCRRRCPHRA